MKNKLKLPLFINHFFIKLFGIYFFFMLTTASLNLLPAHLVELGASRAFIGFFMNIPSLEMIFLTLFLGVLTNKYRRKSLLLLGMTLYLLSMIGMYWQWQNLNWLLIFRLLGSIAFGLGFSLIATFLFDHVPPTSRKSALALLGIAGIISNPIGSFLGEHLLTQFDVRALFLITALFSVVEIILLKSLPQEEPSLNNSFASPLYLFIRPGIRKLLLLSFILGGAFAVLATFTPAFTMEKFGKPMLFLYFAGFAFVGVTARIFFHQLLETIPVKRLLVVAFIFMTLAYTGMLWLKEPLLLTLIGILYGVAHSILYPVLYATIVNTAPDTENIRYNNTYLAAFTSGSILITFFTGIIGDYGGFFSIYFIMALLAGSGILVANTYQPKN